MVENLHALHFLEDSDRDEAFRIEFSNGEIMVLRSCSRIDASIDGKPDGWSGCLVEFATTDPWRLRLFPVGAGVDFKESDIRRIWRGSSGQLLYPQA